MAIYKLQSPTGQIHEIEGPEGATDEQVFEFAASEGLIELPTEEAKKPEKEQSIFSKLWEVSGAPKRGVRGLLTGAKELVTGDEPIFSKENVQEATLKAAEAIKPDYEPATTTDKALAIAADILDPRWAAVGPALKGVGIAGKFAAKGAGRVGKTVARGVGKKIAASKLGAKGLEKFRAIDPTIVEPAVKSAVEGAALVAGGSTFGGFGALAAQQASKAVAKPIAKLASKAFAGLQKFALPRLKTFQELNKGAVWIKEFEAVVGTGDVTQRAAGIYALQQKNPVFNAAFEKFLSAPKGL